MTELGKKLAAGLIGSALVLGGVAAAAPVYASSSGSVMVKSDTRFDAPTVFRGVFFGHGPVAALIPRYFEGIPAATAATTVAENEVMAEIERRSPGAIDRFYEAVGSGSHVRTKQALQSVAGTLNDMHNADSVTNPGNFTGDCAAVVVAVAVAVWLPVVVWTPLWTPSAATTKMEPVKIDAVVHDLVTKLA